MVPIKNRTGPKGRGSYKYTDVSMRVSKHMRGPSRSILRFVLRWSDVKVSCVVHVSAAPYPGRRSPPDGGLDVDGTLLPVRTAELDAEG
jgi:hypothetical protein